MNQLMERTIQMDSRELAEVTGKQHAHVMRDIRNEVESLGEEIAASIFGLGSYLDQNNQERPMYTFGKKGAMQLALKYDAKTRYKVIERLEQLEREQQPTGDTLMALAVIEAQRLLTQKDEQLKLKDQVIEEQMPKVAFADAVSTSKDDILMRDMAKLLNQNGFDTGQNRLFRWMREHGYVLKDNKPSQKSMDLKVLRMIERAVISPEGKSDIKFTTKVTPKGQKYFIEKFMERSQI